MLPAIASALAYIIMVVCNALANALPVGGLNTGEVSALYPNYFVPAGYAFSIWGLIYLLLGVFVISRFLKKEMAAPYAQKINVLFIISCLANASWIFAWHHLLIGLSLIIIIIILISLSLLYKTLAPLPMDRKTAFRTRLPFQLYLGWISVAAIANTTALLVHLGWGGFGIPEPVWASIMVLIAGILGGIIFLRHRDYAFPLVVVWALIAIFARQQILPETAHALLKAGTLAVPAALIMLLAFGFIRQHRTA